MKYMSVYSIRQNSTTFDQHTNGTEALVKAFSKWKPDDGLKILSFVSKLDGKSGFILMETDDPKLVASFASKFLPWSDSEIHPVIEVGEAVQVGEAARAWVTSAVKG